MQYLTVSQDMTLSQLSDIVGERNVDTILNANIMGRAVNIGKEFYARNKALIDAYGGTEVDYRTKLTILNRCAENSDIFERAATGTNEDWITLSQYNCFSDAMKIPDEVKLPSFEGLLGNNIPVLYQIYKACVDSLTEEPHDIDTSIFSKYEVSFVRGSYGVSSSGKMTSDTETYQWFKIPWGEVFLYSSLGDEKLYFPVYPENLDDGVKADYDEMNEMLYQYEPWKVYKSSGPREITFTFEFHRDMWTGDHRDGNANNLIRGCMANCYPNYNGSLVNVSLVSLYIHGSNFITGVMTDCNVKWSGPIGLDGFYLMCELSFTITEIALEALNYKTIRNKGLIG